MPNAVRFKQLSLERQKGELARFKVVQGPDYGAIYVITGTKALIGRGEERKTRSRKKQNVRFT